MIEIKNLSKKFHDKEKEIIALNDVSIDFPDVGLIFIYGKNGSGKTTLLNSISGLCKYDSGIIKIDNKIMENDYNYEIGYIFQNYKLITGLSVYDNIVRYLNIRGIVANDDEIDKVLLALELYKFRNKAVDGLSGGEMQRVSIARVLLANQKIILADEPTHNVDYSTSKIIMSILKKISESRLVIVVSHDYDLIKNYSNTILYMENGEITEKNFLDNNKDEYNMKKSEAKISNFDISIYEDENRYNMDFDFICKDNQVTIYTKNTNVALLNEKYVEYTSTDINFEYNKDYSKVSYNNYLKNKDVFIDITRNMKKISFKIFTLLFFVISLLNIAVMFFATQKIRLSEDVIMEYDKNMIYVNTVDKHILDFEGKYGIDNIYYKSKMHDTKTDFEWNLGNFWSWENIVVSSGFNKPIKNASKYKYLAGGKKNGNEFIVISSGLADVMIKNANLSFLSNYSDLIGLRTNEKYNFYGINTYFEISGVVKEESLNYYYSDELYNKIIINDMKHVSDEEYNVIGFNYDYGFGIPNDDEIFVFADKIDEEINKDDIIKYLGHDYKVQEVISKEDPNLYKEWVYKKYNINEEDETFNDYKDEFDLNIDLMFEKNHYALNDKTYKELSHAYFTNSFNHSEINVENFEKYDDGVYAIHTSNLKKAYKELEKFFGEEYVISDVKYIQHLKDNHINDNLSEILVLMIIFITLAVFSSILLLSDRTKTKKNEHSYYSIGVKRKTMLVNKFKESVIIFSFILIFALFVFDIIVKIIFKDNIEFKDYIIYFFVILIEYILLSMITHFNKTKLYEL